MKKAYKIIFLISMIFILSGVVFAAENEYFLKREIVYQNDRKTMLTDGFAKIMIGQLDFTQYVDDEYLKITPTPDKIEQDKFGNMYAYYDAKGMLKNEKLVITVERKMKTSTFVTEEPILARANGSVTDDNRIYIQPQERIESDATEIINKANEITQDLASDYRKASAIFEYVNTKLNYTTSSSSTNKGALAALKSSSGVCEEFATLFVALCRAEEIPARVIAGYKVEQVNGVDTLIDHTWGEIFLDDYGWLPVEPTVIYTVNNVRVPYWNTFCALNTANYIPTEIYMCEDGNRTYKIIEEKLYEVTLTANDKIVEPAKNTFADITRHTWAHDAIQNLFEREIIEGYSNVEFGPDRNISRIEFICMLSRTLKNLNENFVDGANVYYYPSYNKNHWSKDEYDYLMRCYQFYTPSDIMSAGYFNIANVFGNDINIDQAITRGEVVALMDLFMDGDSSNAYFSDVSNSTKFASSIRKAYSSGLIEGYPDGTFRPNSTITRAEMATILGRYIASNMYVVGE